MSSTVAALIRPVPVPASDVLRRDPAAQAFLLLRIAFTVAPVLFGIDKFAEVLTDDARGGADQIEADGHHAEGPDREDDHVQASGCEDALADAFGLHASARSQDLDGLRSELLV